LACFNAIMGKNVRPDTLMPSPRSSRSLARERVGWLMRFLVILEGISEVWSLLPLTYFVDTLQAIRSLLVITTGPTSFLDKEKRRIACFFSHAKDPIDIPVSEIYRGGGRWWNVLSRALRPRKSKLE
jgi:hypothetical protein